MLVCSEDNFVGCGVSAFLKSKNIAVQRLRYEDTANQPSSYRYHTLVFNIIDDIRASSEIVSFINENRFKFYHNVVVLIIDSQLAKLCVELLDIEKAIVLTEKSPLRDFGQIPCLPEGQWNPRLYRSQKRLTDREHQILAMLVEGLSIAEISDRMQLNYKTIQAHKMKVVIKLGLANSSELNKLIIRFTQPSSFLP